MDIFDNVPPAYRWPIQFCIFSTGTTYFLSIFTSNVSQVDRVWTFLPTIYTAYFALLPLWPHEQPLLLFPYTPKEVGWVAARDFSPRAILMFSLVVIWMCRLSYNTYRRGLFSLKDEDYRWAVLRKQLPAWLFQVVNLTFIAIIQNILLLLLGHPTMISATRQPHTSLAPSDLGLAALALAVLALEFTADNQQYSFQTYKHALLAITKGETRVELYDIKKQWPGARIDWTPEDAKRGFVTRGLWSFVRHPNFACEQTFWWIITLMPLLSPSPPHIKSGTLKLSLLPSFSDALQNFPRALFPFFRHALEPLKHVAPALALTALFFSSTLYTEAITMSKYRTGYMAYKERVGMFGPLKTWEKGMLLSWNGRKAEVEAVVWGKGKGKGKKVD